MGEVILVVLPAISVHGIILDGLSGRYETKIDWELFQLARKYEAGEELSGKVTGIQPYGAFVALDEETQGLVHISEITYGFVKDINDFLSVGRENYGQSVGCRRRGGENQPIHPCITRRAAIGQKG